MTKLAYIALLYVLVNGGIAIASPSFEDAFSPDNGATSLVIKTINEAKKNVRVAA